MMRLDNRFFNNSILCIMLCPVKSMFILMFNYVKQLLLNMYNRIKD